MHSAPVDFWNDKLKQASRNLPWLWKLLLVCVRITKTFRVNGALCYSRPVTALAVSCNNLFFVELLSLWVWCVFVCVCLCEWVLLPQRGSLVQQLSGAPARLAEEAESSEGEAALPLATEQRLPFQKAAGSSWKSAFFWQQLWIPVSLQTLYCDCCNLCIC